MVPSTRSSPAALALLGLAALLAACGEKAAPPPAPAPVRGAANAPAVEASAEQVARAARAGLRCPAPAPAPRAEGQPVDDVLGVRPGQPWDEARQRVLCSAPLLVASDDAANRFRLPPSDPAVRQGFHARFAEDQVRKTGQQILREMQAGATARGQNAARPGLAPGQSRWYVGTMGLPGEERVTHVQREEAYAEGAMPPAETVEQALRAKYGEPTRRSGGARPGERYAEIQLVWVHDPAGRPVRERDALATQCGMLARPDAGVGLSEGCGVVVAADIPLWPDNPGLASGLRVGSVDQARGYTLVAATEAALQQRLAQRRAQQVREAGQQTQAPKL